MVWRKASLVNEREHLFQVGLAVLDGAGKALDKLDYVCFRESLAVVPRHPD